MLNTPDITVLKELLSVLATHCKPRSPAGRESTKSVAVRSLRHCTASLGQALRRDAALNLAHTSAAQGGPKVAQKHVKPRGAARAARLGKGAELQHLTTLTPLRRPGKNGWNSITFRSQGLARKERPAGCPRPHSSRLRLRPGPGRQKTPEHPGASPSRLTVRVDTAHRSRRPPPPRRREMAAAAALQRGRRGWAQGLLGPGPGPPHLRRGAYLVAGHHGRFCTTERAGSGPATRAAWPCSPRREPGASSSETESSAAASCERADSVALQVP